MTAVALFQEHKRVPMIYLRDFRICSRTQPLLMLAIGAVLELKFS